MTTSNSEFDPTTGVSFQQEFKYCSIGKAPSGFPKIRLEMLPADLIRLVGYDPRNIQAPPGRGRPDPHHVSQELVELVREVQRSIDNSKVEEMVAYLAEAVFNGQYADWAELDVVTAAKPDTSRYQESFSVWFPNAAEYLITDGQHRYCAVMDFIRQYPDYANKFTQAVAISVLPQDHLSEWAGQSFHDKNYLRTPVKVTKALAVDSRDLHNVLAKELRNHPAIKEGGGVNEIKDALAATAKEFATHSAIYRFTRGFCEGRRGLDKATIKNPRLTFETYDGLKADLFEYVAELNSTLPHWTVVPGREEYLFRSSPALQALGVVGYNVYTKVADPDERNDMIGQIGEGRLNWRRTNTNDWGTVIGMTVEKVSDDGTTIYEVSPRSNRQAFDNTIRFLQERCGLSAYLERLADGVEQVDHDSV